MKKIIKNAFLISGLISAFSIVPIVITSCSSNNNDDIDTDSNTLANIDTATFYTYNEADQIVINDLEVTYDKTDLNVTTTNSGYEYSNINASGTIVYDFTNHISDYVNITNITLTDNAISQDFSVSDGSMVVSSDASSLVINFSVNDSTYVLTANRGFTFNSDRQTVNVTDYSAFSFSGLENQSLDVNYEINLNSTTNVSVEYSSRYVSSVQGEQGDEQRNIWSVTSATSKNITFDFSANAYYSNNQFVLHNMDSTVLLPEDNDYILYTSNGNDKHTFDYYGNDTFTRAYATIFNEATISMKYDENGLGQSETEDITYYSTISTSDGFSAAVAQGDDVEKYAETDGVSEDEIDEPFVGYWQTDENGDYVLDEDGNKIRVIDKENGRLLINAYVRYLQQNEGENPILRYVSAGTRDLIPNVWTFTITENGDSNYPYTITLSGEDTISNSGAYVGKDDYTSHYIFDVDKIDATFSYSIIDITTE